VAFQPLDSTPGAPLEWAGLEGGRLSSSSEAVTGGIRVQVEAHYSPEHSQPRRNQWFFLYTVQISNEGDETVQLVSRHWIIKDGTGRVEEVRGEGVVGEQPVLGPGDSFEYTSGCPLSTPFGEMRGSYRMLTEAGASFEAEISPFELLDPGAIH
jgi:ApaG protein